MNKCVIVFVLILTAVIVGFFSHSRGSDCPSGILAIFPGEHKSIECLKRIENISGRQYVVWTVELHSKPGVGLRGVKIVEVLEWEEFEKEYYVIPESNVLSMIPRCSNRIERGRTRLRDKNTDVNSILIEQEGEVYKLTILNLYINEDGCVLYGEVLEGVTVNQTLIKLEKQESGFPLNAESCRLLSDEKWDKCISHFLLRSQWFKYADFPEYTGNLFEKVRDDELRNLLRRDVDRVQSEMDQGLNPKVIDYAEYTRIVGSVYDELEEAYICHHLKRYNLSSTSIDCGSPLTDVEAGSDYLDFNVTSEGFGFIKPTLIQVKKDDFDVEFYFRNGVGKKITIINIAINDSVSGFQCTTKSFYQSDLIPAETMRVSADCGIENLDEIQSFNARVDYTVYLGNTLFTMIKKGSITALNNDV